MSEKKQTRILIIAAVWLVIAGLLALGYRVIFGDKLVNSTGSNSQYKMRLTVAADAFSGYAPLRSEAMVKLLKQKSIGWSVQDDHANYPQRLKDLKSGAVDFAVFTIDAYLKAGILAGGEFPGSIVWVIDETVGADALLAYKDAVPSLQSLDKATTRFVATPDSPSEFLSRTLLATLSLPNLPETWLTGADGAADVYTRLKSAAGPAREHAYVMWEPFVSKALKDPGVHVLIDSSKMKGYIVDVLVARRQLIQEHPDVVQSVVEAYARANYAANQAPAGMHNLVMADAKMLGDTLSTEEAQRLVKGIEWKNTLENYAYFGLEQNPSVETLEDMIEKIAEVLLRTGAIEENPVVGRAHTLYFKATLAELSAANFHPGKKVDILEGVGPGKDDLAVVRERAKVPALNEAEWEKLSPVGSVRIDAIEFRRGTADISEFSQSDLDALARRVQSFPTYYLNIVGQATKAGDTEAGKVLAAERAEAVRRYLASKGVSGVRLRAEAKGQLGDESVVSLSFLQATF